MVESDFKNTLEKMIQILQSEKDALIQNDGKQVEKLLVMKEDFVKDFEQHAEDIAVPMDKEILVLVQEIKELQETNLILTKQAMNYAETFISAFQKAAQKDITYSDKATTGNGKSSILNQSL